MPDQFGVEESLQFTTQEGPDDPIVFSIDGESFTAKPRMNGLKYLKYARMMSQPGLQSLAMIEEFLRDVMDDGEYQRFEKFVDDDSRFVDVQQLSSIFLSLYNRYGAGPKAEDRPTKPSSPSRPGREQTGDSSKASSSSGESTPAS